jgi:hypothetical protein
MEEGHNTMGIKKKYKMDNGGYDFELWCLTSLSAMFQFY